MPNPTEPTPSSAPPPPGVQGNKTNVDFAKDITEGTKAAEGLPAPDFGAAKHPPGAGQGTGVPPNITKAQIERVIQDIDLHVKRILDEVDFILADRDTLRQVAQSIRIAN